MTALDTTAPDLRLQLDALHASTCAWSLSLSRRVSAAMERYVLNGHAHGGENFLEAGFVSLCRHSAILKFDQFRQEVAERMHALNADPAVQAARRLLGGRGPLHLDLGVGPDRYTALSNEDWCRQTDTAFFHLMDCGNALQLQAGELVVAAAAAQRIA